MADSAKRLYSLPPFTGLLKRLSPYPVLDYGGATPRRLEPRLYVILGIAHLVGKGLDDEITSRESNRLSRSSRLLSCGLPGRRLGQGKGLISWPRGSFCPFWGK